MTTISPATRRRAPLPAAFFPLTPAGLLPLLSGVSALIQRWRSFRALRQLESMPDHILKDIGWPASGADRL